jgi:enamine deaminase RidA (YjgF/YER057c/UK114 family)
VACFLGLAIIAQALPRAAPRGYDSATRASPTEQAMAIKTINPKDSKALYDNFHFSQAVRSGELLLCSGQIGTGADGKLPADLGEEFTNAWTKVGAVLKAAGVDYSDILEYTTYHVGLQSTIGTFMKVRDQFLKEPWPAWTAIGITELAVPGAHVEVRVTARKRAARKRK